TGSGKTELLTAAASLPGLPSARTSSPGLVNLHIHTNESFSVFGSPTESVWYASREGITYCGINDHYTIAGHREFGRACRIAGLRAVFSIEAIGSDEEPQRAGRRYNDPNNPGRLYLVGKGVVRDLVPGSRGHRTLQDIGTAIRARNKNILDKLNRYAASRKVPLTLSYGQVEELTPRGNATERHVVQRFCAGVEELYPGMQERAEAYRRLLGEVVERDTLEDPAALQDLVRGRLVKNGRPCFVEEDSRAFTSLDSLVDLYLEYGAVPTYPLMGNPVTEEEQDLDRLLERIQEKRLYALDMIDYRTTLERAVQIARAAREHHLPLFVGTEHNTKTMRPLVGPVERAPELRDYFEQSAWFVLGHQLLAGLCGFGAVDEEGRPRIQDNRERFNFFREAGRIELDEEQLADLRMRSPEERRRYFGI
ncbi:MAG: hypothetical protein ACOC8N_08275, partial [Spirochaetota bacterium]